MKMKVIDLKVKTKNPAMLDKTLQQFGAAVVADSFNGNDCKVRCFGNSTFVKFALTNQGYAAEVLGEEVIKNET